MIWRVLHAVSVGAKEASPNTQFVLGPVEELEHIATHNPRYDVDIDKYA